MYRVGPHLPVDTLPPGAYFLVGPPMAGQDSLVLDLLSAGTEAGEHSLLLSTDWGTAAVRRRLDSRSIELSEAFHVVDCTGEGSDGEHISTVSSPGDLTGIGIQLSGHLTDSDTPQRVGVISMSTLLMYADAKRVFRFFHVFANRLRTANALGLFVLNPAAHDESVTDTLLNLCDGAIEFRDGERGSEVRVRSETIRTEWTPR